MFKLFGLSSNEILIIKTHDNRTIKLQINTLEANELQSELLAFAEKNKIEIL